MRITDERERCNKKVLQWNEVLRSVIKTVNDPKNYYHR